MTLLLTQNLNFITKEKPKKGKYKKKSYLFLFSNFLLHIRDQHAQPYL